MVMAVCIIYNIYCATVKFSVWYNITSRQGQNVRSIVVEMTTKSVLLAHNISTYYDVSFSTSPKYHPRLLVTGSGLLTPRMICNEKINIKPDRIIYKRQQFAACLGLH